MMSGFRDDPPLPETDFAAFGCARRVFLHSKKILRAQAPNRCVPVPFARPKMTNLCKRYKNASGTHASQALGRMPFKTQRPIEEDVEIEIRIYTINRRKIVLYTFSIRPHRSLAIPRADKARRY